MATNLNDLPALEEQARQLLENVRSLSSINRGLGTASAEVVVATQSLGHARESLDGASERLNRLNASTEAAVGQLRELRPEELRSDIDRRIAELRAKIDQIQVHVDSQLEASLSQLREAQAADLSGLRTDVEQQLGAAEVAASARHAELVAAVNAFSREVSTSASSLKTQLSNHLVESRAAVEQAEQRLHADLAALSERQKVFESMVTAALGENRLLQEAVTQRLESVTRDAQAIRRTSDAIRTTTETARQEGSSHAVALVSKVQEVEQRLTDRVRLSGRRRQWVFFLLLFLLLLLTLIVSIPTTSGT